MWNQQGVCTTPVVPAGALLSSILIIFAATFNGCATPAERGAFEKFRALERSTYSASAVSASRPLELPQLDENATLSDYLAYAALNNPGLEAAFYRWKAALEKIPQARSLPDPRFNYGYFIREVETRVGPQEQKLGISQTFPWLAKLRLRGEVALQAANAAEQRYQATKLALFYRVGSTYAEYYYLSRAIALTRENMELLKYLEGVVRIKYAAAAAAQPDLIKAQVELGKLEDRLRTLAEMRGPLAAKLNAALGRAFDHPIPWPSQLPAPQISLPEEELFQWLAQANPELKALAFEVKKGRTSVQLARQDYFPDVTLGLDYIDTDSALMPGAKDSGKDPVLARISVNLPIWWAKYRAGQRQAEARLRSARRSLEDRENVLETEVKLALFGMEDAQRKIDLYRDTLIPKGKEHLKATETAYQAGKSSFLDLIDAERVLLEFELSYERALADHASSLAELEMLVGKEIPRK